MVAELKPIVPNHANIVPNYAKNPSITAAGPSYQLNYNNSYYHYAGQETIHRD
jgi:hypothetical protein